ncbi:MAG: hypothetical protein M1838_005800 [Thelocarpon superellum]|nr:MAG: hypothetical protein M1838_005800 [Thelocarpon superellum]
MRLSLAVLASLATTFTAASPIERRAGIDDVAILNYALTLEYLERKFYEEGLANYTHEDFVKAGFPDPFYKNLQEIYVDEKTHVDFLSTGIKAAGGVPVTEATYSFPTTDAKSFVTLSSILEGVGVSAYLGAAASILNKDYLTAAGSILTIEARHTSYIRSLLGEEPFPTSFDVPLDFDEVFTLASAFIVKFAKNSPALPFRPFPALPLLCTEHYYEAGCSTVTFTGAAKYAKDGDIYAVFFSGMNKNFVKTRVDHNDLKLEYGHSIPADVAGQAYIVLSKSATSATDADIVAGPAELEVYPEGGAPHHHKAACS